MSLNWLEGMKKSMMFYRLQTDRSVTKRWIIDYGCSEHITSVQRERSSWGILLRARWLVKEQSSFALMWMHHYSSRRSSCSKSRYNLLSWNSTWRRVQFQFWRWSYGSFQRSPCEISGRTCRLCLHAAKFRGYSWWIAVILNLKMRDWGKIGDYDGFELGCLVLPWR